MTPVLEHLDIKNYRSCQSTSFPFRKDLSILIGPNGTGKTNILNAILLLRKLCEAGQQFRNIQAVNECTLKAKFLLGDKRATLTAKIGIDTDETNSDVIATSDESWYMPDFTESKKRVKIPLGIADMERTGRYVVHMHQGRRVLLGHQFLDGDERSLQPIREIGHFLLNARYYSASQFTNPSLCPVSFEVENEAGRRRGVRLRGHAKFLYDLYLASKNPSESSYDEFFQIIGPDGIGLIDGLIFKEISTSSIDYTVRSGGRVRKQTKEKILIVPQFKIGTNELSPNQLSEGTFKTITLLFYVITEASSLLLVEEPEVCVHHGLLSSIVELIRTYSAEKQIIMSTHSDFVLDEVLPENVFKVSRDSEVGTALSAIPKSMSKRELTALKQYLEEEGNLGEYWRHGGLD